MLPASEEERGREEKNASVQQLHVRLEHAFFRITLQTYSGWGIVVNLRAF